MDAKKTFNYIVVQLQNYASQHGFKKAVLGISGGIDSAVVAAIAKEAFTSRNVLALFMPSKFTSQQNFSDARIIADNLNINYEVIPINNLFDAYLQNLSILKTDDVTKVEENIQSRIRANILMAYSNKFNYLVLATANKSEIMTGYFTLYGDAVGGIAPLGSVYKTEVYSLAAYVNKKYKKDIIPRSVFEKKPSAELRHNQTDQDSLPSYVSLDRILQLYCDEGKKEEEIIAHGFDRALVTNVIEMVKRSEFKRSQIPKPIPLFLPNSL